MLIPFRAKKTSTRKNKITGEAVVQVTDPGQSGLRISHWRDWVENYFLSDPQVEEGDLLLADRLKQHFDKPAEEKLKEKNIELRHFPVGGAAELSQLDNCLIKDFRRDLCDRKWSDWEEKKKAIFDTWASFPAYRIVGYWQKCGYSVRHVRQRQRSVWSRKGAPEAIPSVPDPPPKRLAKRKRSTAPTKKKEVKKKPRVA
jgi:hypothetical protein